MYAFLIILWHCFTYKAILFFTGKWMETKKWRQWDCRLRSDTASLSSWTNFHLSVSSVWHVAWQFTPHLTPCYRTLLPISLKTIVMVTGRNTDIWLSLCIVFLHVCVFSYPTIVITFVYNSGSQPFSVNVPPTSFFSAQSSPDCTPPPPCAFYQ
jgi:hypothetical protein